MPTDLENLPLILFTALARRTNLLVVLTDRAGRIEWANLAFAERTGLTVEQLIKHKFFSVLAPYSRIDVQQTYIREQLLKGESFKFELAYTSHNQTDYWLLIDGQPIYDTEGIVNQYCVLATDITLRKQTEIALQQAKEALEQTNKELETRVYQRTEALSQAKEGTEQALQELQAAQTQLIQAEKTSSLGQMVAGIAHEINNPVNAIAGNLKPAQQYIEDLFNLLHLYEKHYPQPIPEIQTTIEEIDLEFVTEDLPKLLSSMQEAASRIQKMSASMKVFIRGDSSEKVAFNVHDGLDSTLLILQHRLKANSDRPTIEVTRNYANLPLIHCFPGQLNQVFMNLLVNAIDALEEQNSERSYAEVQANPNQISIRTSLTADNQAILIQIKDNGIGMSDEVREKIFNHLFTTKPVGYGTGLGLSISRQIIEEKHGGQLTCTAIPAEGTEFNIYLPIH